MTLKINACLITILCFFPHTFRCHIFPFRKAVVFPQQQQQRKNMKTVWKEENALGKKRWY